MKIQSQYLCCISVACISICFAACMGKAVMMLCFLEELHFPVYSTELSHNFLREILGKEPEPVVGIPDLLFKASYAILAEFGALSSGYCRYMLVCEYHIVIRW